jgi:hypothetical protein
MQGTTATLDPDRCAIIATVQGGVSLLLATGSTRELEDGLDLMLEPLRRG